jgi:protein ImuB
VDPQPSAFSPQPCYVSPLVTIAQDFSPRYERHRDDLVSIDVSGLGRLLGPARAIGEELRRDGAARGVCVHVAIAGTRMAAVVLAQARPGLTLVEPGKEAEALAPLPIGIFEKIYDEGTQSSLRAQREHDHTSSACSAVSLCKRWGVNTLGELAALPPADLAARLGQRGLVWQAIARGEDVRPFVPDVPEERFESSLELEWPIEGLEPLSFVLTRLLEPLSTRLERRDRGAAVLHVELRLVTRLSTLRPFDRLAPREIHALRLELPSPMRDVRTLRTLALLHLESHPPAAAIDRVAVVIDPAPGRVLQHTLFTRAHPTPEQLSTLVARLGALMGQDRIGTPATVDSYRPGAFAMTAFATEPRAKTINRLSGGSRSKDSANPADSAVHVVSAWRRCRQPVPARVATEAGRPVRATTDRRGFAGGTVRACAGPWRTSGEWWNQPSVVGRQSLVESGLSTPWNRDEWDVALGDGAVYRIFRDRETDGWFIDAIVD